MTRDVDLVWWCTTLLHLVNNKAVRFLLTVCPKYFITHVWKGIYWQRRFMFAFINDMYNSVKFEQSTLNVFIYDTTIYSCTSNIYGRAHNVNGRWMLNQFPVIPTLRISVQETI